MDENKETIGETAEHIRQMSGFGYVAHFNKDIGRTVFLKRDFYRECVEKGLIAPGSSIQ